jgi:predicted ATPase/class 3 adenylate cyclase
MTPQLPEGKVTFLFTDIEGSTRLWEQAPDSMMAAIRVHDETIEAAVASHGGVPVRPRGEGDSRFIVFANAQDAVAGAAAMQRQLASVEWQTPAPLRVRAALHTGTADLRLGDYYGSTVNRAARLRAIAHGGQTILSGVTYALLDDFPSGVSLRDMGRHRLKDLTEPEQVYQLDIEGLAESFPPLASLNVVANNLPQQMIEFIGRERELAEVRRLLDEVRLVTVIAPGGVGKTRLALQAGAESIADYPDGVFFIGLADISSSEDILLEVAEAIGLGFSSDEDVQTQLLNYLANRQQLFIFDNFEHLIDGAVIVSEILRSASEVTVLATSRAKLNLSGETIFYLSGLEIVKVSLEDAEQVSGARLFIDAARRARPDFALQQDDMEPLTEILRLTHGVPLGILLAAAWVDMLSVADIAAEVAKSLDFLESELSDVPERQRSVRAVFEYSWNLLSPDQQSLFAALSIFRGGFAREAAEVVAGASLHDLAALAGKSLLTPSPDTGRYTVHELLRQYAEQELNRDAERAKQLIEAHAAFFGTLVEAAWALEYESDQPKMAAIIESDLDNIRLAWRHHVATQNATAIRKMIGPLWMVYEFRGWYPQAVALFGGVLERLDETSLNPEKIIVRALSSAVQSYFLALQGQVNLAAEVAAEAVNTLRDTDDHDAFFIALNGRLVALMYSGRFAEAIRESNAGVAVAETIDDPFRGALISVYGILPAIVSGDIEAAKSRLDTVQSALESRGEHQIMSWTLGHRARIALIEGKPNEAIDLFGRAVERSTQLGYMRGIHVNLDGQGGAYLAAGDYEAAETAFIKSLAAAEQMSMVREMLGMIAKIAGLRALTGRSIEAVELNATVVTDPGSTQRFLGERTSIRENASAALAELQGEMDPGEYAAAYTRGTSMPYDVTVKKLISSLSKV